jgi:hypothetical protein
MSCITLAMAAIFAMVSLGAPKAHAEDTAAILVAMPNKTVEQFYLKQLCDRVALAEKNLFHAMDGVVDCTQRGCTHGDAYKAMVFEEAAQRVHANSFGAYEDAASAYRAKRDVDARSCEAASDASGVH